MRTKEIRTKSDKLYRILNALRMQNEVAIKNISLNKSDINTLKKINARIFDDKIFVNNKDFRVYLRKSVK